MNVDASNYIQVTLPVNLDVAKLSADNLTRCLSKPSKNERARMIVRIRSGKYQESVTNLQEHFYKTYGTAILAREFDFIEFIDFDKFEIQNSKAGMASCSVLKSPKPKQFRQIVSEITIDKLVNEINQKEIIVASSYANLEMLCVGCVWGFGERGREWFIKLCGGSVESANEHYTEFLQNRNRKCIPRGVFYWMLSEAGMAIPTVPDENAAIIIAQIGKKVGLIHSHAIEQVENITGMESEKASQIVNQVYERSDLTLSDLAEVPETRGKAFDFWLRFKFNPMKNAITRRIESDGERLETADFNSIWLEAREAFNSDKINYELVERTLLSKRIPECNPITDFIDKNRHRNKNGNIDSLIQTIRPYTAESAVFIRKWIISLIAAYDGHPVRSILILISGQNTGKTEWFRRLLPDGLKRYYAESKFIHGKDDELLMCEKLMILIDELAGLPQKDFKALKEVSSKNIFSLREPYGRNNIDVKRLALLAGTSNEKVILNDPTGNTRLLPVEFEHVNYSLYNSIDKTELFMEAVREYESGAEWQLTKEELHSLEELSADFRDNSYQELIMQYFRVPAHGQEGERLPASSIKSIIEANSGQRSLRSKDLGIELKKIFGEAKSARINGHSGPVKCYSVVRTSEFVVESINKHVVENEPIPF